MDDLKISTLPHESAEIDDLLATTVVSVSAFAEVFIGHLLLTPAVRQDPVRWPPPIIKFAEL